MTALKFSTKWQVIRPKKSDEISGVTKLIKKGADDEANHNEYNPSKLARKKLKRGISFA